MQGGGLERTEFSLAAEERVGKGGRGGRVDVRQLWRLPTHMSGVLGGQLLSPVASSACLHQRKQQSHSRTLPTNGRPVNEGNCFLTITSLWSPRIASVALDQTRRHSRRLQRRAAPCVEATQESSASRLMSDNSAGVSVPTPSHAPPHTSQSCVFSWLSSSRSRLSTPCSPAPWSTSSRSSIRALKSSASWSVPTLRSSATTWNDSQRWIPHAAVPALVKCVSQCAQTVLCLTFFQTIGNVLLSYADIIAKDFPNHVKKEKVVNVPERRHDSQHEQQWLIQELRLIRCTLPYIRGQIV